MQSLGDLIPSFNLNSHFHTQRQIGIEQSVRELAVEIRQRVEDWGAAMRDGRWEPVLSVEVLPGGETRYRQLETLMRNSGVRVERRRN